MSAVHTAESREGVAATGADGGAGADGVARSGRLRERFRADRAFVFHPFRRAPFWRQMREHRRRDWIRAVLMALSTVETGRVSERLATRPADGRVRRGNGNRVDG